MNRQQQSARADPRREFGQLADDVQLSVAEAAAVLGLSVHTLKSWRAHGRGPAAAKFGRAVRISVGTLRAFMAEGRKRT